MYVIVLPPTDWTPAVLPDNFRFEFALEQR